VSTVALAMLSPMLLLLALLVRLTSQGPALFCQERLGRHGVAFNFYKFRTMHVNAPDLRNPDGSTFNAEDDPRVTPLGRFLRKTSLDELPQLINVLKGEMSLVGPRPDQIDQAKLYTEHDRRKLLAKPGITGLAQISGRNSISWEQRKRLDVQYVENQNLWLDLRILFKTLPYVLLRRDVFVDSERSREARQS
jgi:undecaprenyl phosphate N,N'-diacetylbacillosamine 1-phosphate transferase